MCDDDHEDRRSNRLDFGFNHSLVRTLVHAPLADDDLFRDQR
jgi:hypothetical protein